MEVPFVAAGWALVLWGRLSGGMLHRASTSRTTASQETRPAFAAEATSPETWHCPRCGLPATLDSLNPPPPPKIEPYKTHLAYVKERRTDKEAADILTEALQALRARRERGEVIY